MGLDAIGDDLDELEENFEIETENDESGQYEEIVNLSQEFNEVLSQDENEVFWRVLLKSSVFSGHFRRSHV